MPLPRLRSSLLALSVLTLASACLSSGASQAPQSAPTARTMPRHVTALGDDIARYEHIAATGGWPVFPPGGKLKPGIRAERIATLREILRIMGDYAPAQPPQNPSLFDKELARALAHFQRRHGLQDDGEVGAQTQAALSVPVEERLAQMRATQERMQAYALPEDEKYVLVNLPGFYLQAMEAGEMQFESRVIVGEPKNATPTFAQPITQVIFNPPWHVPHRIAAREMLPKVRKDPEFLAKGGFKVVMKEAGAKITVDPAEVDWEQISEHNFPFRIVQASGDGNALGKIKFSLPDTDNIYLHSTANPKLFDKPRRDLSHGCIRVEKARELAHFVIPAKQDKIDGYYDGTTTHTVQVSPVPVHVVYWPAWVAPDGTLHFSPDMYQRDTKRVAEILEEMKKSSSTQIARE